MNIYQKRINKITNETLILMNISYYKSRKISKACIKYFGGFEFIEDIGVCNINKNTLNKIIKECKK